jgi:hypothetical protein
MDAKLSADFLSFGPCQSVIRWANSLLDLRRGLLPGAASID